MCIRSSPFRDWIWDDSIHKLFDILRVRVDMEFTEGEFSNFRDSLNDQGFSLREIERVPYNEPTSIS